MVKITSNATSLLSALKRVDQKWVPGILDRLQKLDFAATAGAVLDSLMQDDEKRFLPYILHGIAVTRMELGFGIKIGAPPGLIDRARLASHALRYPGRLGQKSTNPASYADFRSDIASVRELVQLWVETPGTNRDDPESGKIRDERDAGFSDEEIVDRLSWILGLSGDRTGHTIDSSAHVHGRHMPLQAARESLSGALERFYQAMFGQPSGMTQARLNTLIGAVQKAWMELILFALPEASSSSIKRALAAA